MRGSLRRGRGLGTRNLGDVLEEMRARGGFEGVAVAGRGASAVDGGFWGIRGGWYG